MNSYICALLFNGLCRVSVPIFFMISGALLLEQPVDYHKNNKRTTGILVKTVLWTLIFLVWDFFYLGERYDIRMMFSTPVRVHFWFLFVMFGIYITIPLWQKMVSGDSKRLMYYFSVLFIVTMAISFVLKVLKMYVTYEIPLVGSSCYAGYFIMGYVLRHFAEEIRIKKWVCIAVWAVCVTATNLLTLFSSLQTRTHVETFSDFRSVFIGVSAMAVFYLFMKIKPPKSRRWVAGISKHSFNIYMMHVFFLDILQENINITKVNAWIGFPIFFVILISFSFAFSWIFEKAKGKCKSIL